MKEAEVSIIWSLRYVRVGSPDRLRDVMDRSRVNLVIISSPVSEGLGRKLQATLCKYAEDFSTMVYWQPEKPMGWVLQPLAVFLRRLGDGPACRLGITLQQHVLQHLADKDLSVGRLARDMNMSISCFYARVKAVTGVSPNQYVRLLRMERARQLLLDPLLSIGEVAYAIGIMDVSYFSRLFRMECGSSPSCWRKIHGELISSENSAKER